MQPSLWYIFIMYKYELKLCRLSIWKQDLVYQFFKYNTQPCCLNRGYGLGKDCVISDTGKVFGAWLCVTAWFPLMSRDYLVVSLKLSSTWEVCRGEKGRAMSSVNKPQNRASCQLCGMLKTKFMQSTKTAKMPAAKNSNNQLCGWRIEEMSTNMQRWASGDPFLWCAHVGCLTKTIIVFYYIFLSIFNECS